MSYQGLAVLYSINSLFLNESVNVAAFKRNVLFYPILVFVVELSPQLSVNINGS